MLRTLLACSLLWSLAFAAPLRADDVNALSADEKAAGFELLFDGRSLDGWKHAGNWKIADGAITREGKGGSLVYTVKKVPDDFELRFQWKVARGSNSGVYYRPTQYEYQILDNAVHNDGKNPRTSAASLYFCMPPSVDATRPIGEWNEGRIVCKGTVIQHWLNGRAVVDFDYADPKWADQVLLLKVRGGDVAARGAQLNLQDHGDPVWYRGLKWRAIPADEHVRASADFQPAAVPAEKLAYEKKFVADRLKAEADKKPGAAKQP